jgi:hypothetical protein
MLIIKKRKFNAKISQELLRIRQERELLTSFLHFDQFRLLKWGVARFEIFLNVF